LQEFQKIATQKAGETGWKDIFAALSAKRQRASKRSMEEAERLVSANVYVWSRPRSSVSLCHLRAIVCVADF